MIIADLSYQRSICDLDRLKGGVQNNYYDNRAAAVSAAYADGLKASAAAGTSTYVDRGYSQSKSFSEAQSLS